MPTSDITESLMGFRVDVSIIIVNWNSAKDLHRCLSSIYRCTTNLEFEVIVVDNASYDGSEDIVRTHFPETTFLQLDNNLGFARANNLAAARASGHSLLFLNPDTEIIGPAIRTMSVELEGLPNAGTVGCKLLNTDHSIQTSCVSKFPTILNQALDFHFLRKRFPKSRLWGARPLFEDVGPVEVDWVSGACILIDRDVFEEIGQFSTDYFMYSEDVDLCYKVRKEGLRVYYVGNATVIHHGGKSSENRVEAHFSAVEMRKSRSKFMLKTKGPLYAQAFRFMTILVALVRLAILRILLLACQLLARMSRCLPDESSIRWQLAAQEKSLCNSSVKWYRILRWALGLDKGTKLTEERSCKTG